MSVRVSWNAGVTKADNEPVSFSISDHESLVGNLAVSSNPLQGVAQGARGRHVAQIEIAGQREAETVILQSLRRLVQERDLASHAQSLFRFRDHLWRQSHPPQKRRYRDTGAFEARDRQAAETTLRHRDRGQVLLGTQSWRGSIAHS